MFLAIKVGIIASHVTPAPEKQTQKWTAAKAQSYPPRTFSFWWMSWKKMGLRAWLKKEEKKERHYLFKKNDKEQH